MKRIQLRNGKNWRGYLISMGGSTQYSISFLDLFVLDYAICKEASPEEETVGYKVSKLVGSSAGTVDSHKVQLPCTHVQSAVISRIGYYEYRKRRGTIIESLRRRGIFGVGVVSGKDYLLPLMRIRMQGIVRLRITNDAPRIAACPKLRCVAVNQMRHLCCSGCFRGINGRTGSGSRMTAVKGAGR